MVGGVTESWRNHFSIFILSINGKASAQDLVYWNRSNSDPFYYGMGGVKGQWRTHFTNKTVALVCGRSSRFHELSQFSSAPHQGR